MESHRIKKFIFLKYMKNGGNYQKKKKEEDNGVEVQVDNKGIS